MKTKEKEVYFNERNEWMGTSWDVQVANLPEAVKKIGYGKIFRLCDR